MPARSHVSWGTVLKHFGRVARHPWIARRLAALEAEKWLFPLFHPRAREGVGGRLRQVSIRITDLCNLRCRTCGQWGEQGFLKGADLAALKARQVSPERYREIFADLVRHGHRPMVYFWGGEPMLYEGILEVMEAAAGLRLPVSIATNGTRVAERAERLVAAPLFLVQLSIDGPTAAIHNRLRPRAGGGDNFADLKAALTALRQARTEQGRDLPLLASLTVISRDNAASLVEIYETFAPQVDLCVFYLSWWIDAEAAREHERDFADRFGFSPTLHRGWLGSWRPDDYEALSRELTTLVARSRPLNRPPVILIPPLTLPEDLRRYFTDHRARFGYDQCVSIFQVTEVDSNGDVSPCRDYHDYVVGNLKESTLTELWNSPAYRRFRQSLATRGLMPVCSRCCGLMGY
ncbi:MAG: radical SAM protein [Syntrophobacterales bacterium]|nr:radical SAM protein [Syntrophobacterales bacterium]